MLVVFLILSNYSLQVMCKLSSIFFYVENTVKLQYIFWSLEVQVSEPDIKRPSVQSPLLEKVFFCLDWVMPFI